MKIPETPPRPDPTEIVAILAGLQKGPEGFLRLTRNPKEYYHWDKLKHVPPPEGYEERLNP